MQVKKSEINIIESANQLSLFGYNDLFDSWVKLFKKQKLPNCILLTGPKGIGKATFAYHFINCILSEGEKDKYLINDFKINQKNYSYKLVTSNTHPNFFLIDNKDNNEQIKITQVRNLLKFISKSTYSKNLKIILIDNFENFNLNSTNALLKTIEEPSLNTFFFLIHNNSHKIIKTIKSRCMNFKIYFSEYEKKKIFYNILDQYKDDLQKINIENHLYFDTPGNLIKKILFLSKNKVSVDKNSLSYAHFFLDSYLNEKDPRLLSFASFFIEKFYCELFLNNLSEKNIYSQNYTKIIKKLSDMKNFNLSDKNSFILIKETLANETS